jgi:hypothetical protein
LRTMSRQEVRITQEFLNRYVSLDPLPAQARVGDALQVSGQLLLNTSNPLINLTYEPFPIPVTVDWLDSTGAYASPARSFDALPPGVNTEGCFSTQVTLDSERRAGTYHIRVWVIKNGEQIQAANVIVDVTP